MLQGALIFLQMKNLFLKIYKKIKRKKIEQKIIFIKKIKLININKE